MMFPNTIRTFFFFSLLVINDKSALSDWYSWLSVKMRKLASPSIHDLLLDLSVSLCVCVCVRACVCACVHVLSSLFTLPLCCFQISCQKWRRGLFWWEKRVEMERWSKHCRYIITLLTLKAQCGPLTSINVEG